MNIIIDKLKDSLEEKFLRKIVWALEKEHFAELETIVDSYIKLRDCNIIK
jgi:hypothetical protein